MSDRLKILWAVTITLLHSTMAEPGPFGIGSCHVNNRSVRDMEGWIPRMADAGIRFHRTAQTNWNALEVRKGEWRWELLDAQMAYLEKNGMSCGGLLIGSVPWDHNSKGLPVDNLPAWENYVSTVVGHLRGRVKYWEVWNEPPNFMAEGQTAGDYAKVVMSAYRAAKAADPDCLVGLAAKSAHVNFLEKTIMGGARNHFDFITLHPYETLGTVAGNTGTEPLFLNIVPSVRKMLDARNPARKDVPIIFTELGADARKGADYPAQALVKAYAMGIAQGVMCIEWFEGRDGDSGPMGLLDGKGKPRPAYHALKRLITHLGQRPGYLGWVLLDDKHPAFLFQGAREQVLITWAAKGKAATVDLQAEAEVIGSISGLRSKGKRLELSGHPTLVLDPPAGIVREAQTNFGKAMSWGGDYTLVDEVSVSFENGIVEKGLHSLSGDRIGEAVVAYGGSGRAGGIPGGNAFVVDPGFLTYDTRPLEIEVVVRRNPANDNAGFKLEYESTDGFKNCGWYTVPDNKKWHTKKWIIDDPQFVAMWGYNFTLNSDGNTFNKYFIQKVTVRKLPRK